MAEMTFIEMLEAKWAEGKYVCVGLDPVYGKMPNNHFSFIQDKVEVMREFLCGIVEDTHDIVACYKPNSAFFEEYSWQGFQLLEHLIGFIHEINPTVPVILDAKRGDIGATNECYARMAFDHMKADALTIHPYLGREANKPFLDRADKGVFVLCRTSNPGAGEFQDMEVAIRSDTSTRLIDGETGKDVTGEGVIFSKLFRRVAEHVDDPETWNQNGNCGLVTGATYPEEIVVVRKIAQDLPLLIPGIGKQGGDLEASVTAARHRFLINSSSGIIFADDPRAETLKLHEGIQSVLAKLG